MPSQTQLPFTHRWPGAQGGFEPQRQAPVLQLSALVALHVPQAAPPVPQLEVVFPARQLLPEQQPEQDVASQMQAPPTHRWPMAHEGLAPQLHAPAVEQLSARVASQAMQAAPPVPHVDKAGVRHALPEQQPVGQFVAEQPLQRPPMQLSPIAQAWHAAPPVPQAAA